MGFRDNVRNWALAGALTGGVGGCLYSDPNDPERAEQVLGTTGAGAVLGVVVGACKKGQRGAVPPPSQGYVRRTDEFQENSEQVRRRDLLERRTRGDDQGRGP